MNLVASEPRYLLIVFALRRLDDDDFHAECESSAETAGHGQGARGSAVALRDAGAEVGRPVPDVKSRAGDGRPHGGLWHGA